MSALHGKLERLGAHAVRLRRCSAWLLGLGAVALVIAVLVIWPDPSAGGVLQKTRLLAGAELAAALEADGLFAQHRSESFMTPGDQALRINFALMLAVVFAVWTLTRRWAMLWRLTLVGAAWPVVLALVSTLTVGRSDLPTFAIGVIADRPGVVLSEETRRSLSRYRDLRTQAYFLNAGVFTGAAADQAHLLLAQRAYHDDDPEEVGRQLAAMTGAWTRPPIVARSIAGVLFDYARAHGVEAGEVAAEFSGGRPHFALRHRLAAWSVRLAALLMVGAIIVFLVYSARERAVRRLTRVVDGLGEPNTLVS